MKIERIASFKVLNAPLHDLQLIQQHLDIIFSFVQSFLGLLDLRLDISFTSVNLVVHNELPVPLPDLLLDVLPQVAPRRGDLVVLLDAACVGVAR